MGPLDQVLGVRTATSNALSSDPIMSKALDAVTAQGQADQATAQRMTQNVDQRTTLLNTAPPERPSVPRLQPLPPAPVTEPKDPMRVFGQFLPVMAALGALTTRDPAVNALNAATAAISAAKKNDKEALEKSHTDWLDNLKLAVQNNDELTKQYNLALGDTNMSMADRMAKVNALAAVNKDELAIAALKSGNVDGLLKLAQVRNGASAQLGDLVTATERNDLARQEQKMQDRREWAKIEVDKMKAGQVSMGDAIGPLLVKMAGGQSLNPAELAAIDKYKEVSESRGGGLFSAVPQAAPPSSAPGTPAAAAAAPATAAPAAVTSTPPVSMLKEGKITDFSNGQSWTLRGGKPERVK